MPIRVHNTLTGSKEVFDPVRPGEAGIYVCGPTVYGELHIGNFRCFVVFDTLARFLRSRGFKVKKVQNFTDVDDKTIGRARAEGVPLRELTDRYIGTYHRDALALNIEEQVEVRATDHIDHIIRYIERLVREGSAYEAEGSVYFAVGAYRGYGKLSRQAAEDRLAGARVDPEPGKRDPRDFVLWKRAKPDEPSWDSPWGPGRPGWHIECSVMAEEELGVPFDIHGGGEDLIFPHHENELAQTGALGERLLARYWMHNAMLTLAGEKMSKSLGNISSVASLLETYSPGALRLFLLSAHYRTPLATDREALDASETAYRRTMTALRRMDEAAAGAEAQGAPEGEEWDAFQAALDDDLNTAGAMAALFDRVRRANSEADAGLTPEGAAAHAAAIRAMLEVLGIEEAPPEEAIASDAMALIEARSRARREKDWATADRIRAELEAKGIRLEDTPEGVRWHRL